MVVSPMNIFDHYVVEYLPVALMPLAERILSSMIVNKYPSHALDGYLIAPKRGVGSKPVGQFSRIGGGGEHLYMYRCLQQITQEQQQEIYEEK